MTVNPVGPELPKDQSAERKKFSDKFKEEMRTKTQKSDEEQKSKQKKEQTPEEEEPGFAIEQPEKSETILDVQTPQGKTLLTTSGGQTPPSLLETPPPPPTVAATPAPSEQPSLSQPPSPLPQTPVPTTPQPVTEEEFFPSEETYYPPPTAPVSEQEAPPPLEEPQSAPVSEGKEKTEETETFYKAFQPKKITKTAASKSKKAIELELELEKKLKKEEETIDTQPPSTDHKMKEEGSLEKKRRVEETGIAAGMEGVGYTPGAAGGVALPAKEGPLKPYLSKEAEKLFTKMVGQITLMKEKTLGGKDDVQVTRISLSQPDYEKSVFFNTIIEIKEYATARGQFNVEILCDTETAEKLAEQNVRALIAAFQGSEYAQKNITITNIRIGRKPVAEEIKKVSRAKKGEDQQNG